MSGPYRVVQWGVGNTGAKSLRFILDDPALELVGLFVSRRANVGRDAGELAGGDLIGVAATSDAGAIIATKADCVVYMAAEPTGSPAQEGTAAWQSVATICQLLASGKNVVSTGISGLANPRAFGDEVAARLSEAAQQGGTTFFGTGIEPGFMCDALALTLTSVTREVRSIRTQEMISYATYDQPGMHVSNGGMWGAPCEKAFSDTFAERLIAGGMGGPVTILADVLAIPIDDVTARVELAEAPESFELPIGVIAEGSLAAYRFEVLGLIKGEPVVAVEHITRIHDRAAPHWPALNPGGFRILIEGTPSYRVEVVIDEADANIGACTGTAARAVNAIPVVCAAPSGVCSFLDLPLIPAVRTVS
jgi:2,4-diaminopentanoate dehydrogenase